MGTSPESVKGWIGIVLLGWSVVRPLLSLFGVHIPDLPLLDVINTASAGTGTYLLAKAPPMGKKKYYA